jgi:hypothetical protein
MWECAIEDCGHQTDDAERLLLHQVIDHERIRCAVCGTMVADGYFALHHTFAEHTRAQYVRAYAAAPDEIAHRESVLEAVAAKTDVEAVLAELRARENVDLDDVQSGPPERTQS